MDNNKHIPLRTIESTPALGNLDRICDMEEGRLSGKVFWDPAIYEQELEKIFARCWLFVAHESQLPKSGDYLTTSMGEDEVLVVRQKDASIKVFLNACPHRGNKVCFAEAARPRLYLQLPWLVVRCRWRPADGHARVQMLRRKPVRQVQARPARGACRQL